MSVVDFGAARFNAASSASDVTARDTLAEALRRVESGQWAATSVIVLGLEVDEDDHGTTLEIMHGGPASSNERLGMQARAMDLMLRNLNGDA